MSGETPRGWQNQEALTCPELKGQRRETVRGGATEGVAAWKGLRWRRDAATPEAPS